jgi:folate-dependent phosphoribosylglycinamide formyltransferase PurN
MMMLGQQIEALRAADVPITALILDSKGPSSRDIAIHADRTEGRLPDLPLDSIVKDDFPIIEVISHNSAKMIQLIQNERLDILVNAGTPRILSNKILDSIPFGVLNCHPGLLPAFRGCSCVEWALHLGEPVGNTIHFMSAGIDEGPVLIKEVVPIVQSDTYVDVRVKVYKAGHRLMANSLQKIMEGTLSPVGIKQSEGGRYFKPMDDITLNQLKQKLESKWVP